MRFEHKKVNLTIVLGTAIAESVIKLPAGTCVGMGAISTGNDPTKFVDLSVLDNGSELVEGSDYRFFVKTNGGRWIDGLRPMSFDCNREVTVRLAAASNLAADLSVQVIFVIQQL